MSSSRAAFTLALPLLLPAGAGFADSDVAGAPVTVSPGALSTSTLVSPCTTFSWGRLGDPTSYELVVYRLEEQRDSDPVAVLSQTVPGTALSWTPSLERCPTPGNRYAWSVRAVGESPDSPWSSPRFFEVAERTSVGGWSWTPSPSAEKGAAVGDLPTGSAAANDQRTSPRRSPAAFASDGPTPNTVEAGAPVGTLEVDGELRTVDPDDPDGSARLWGRGRVDAEVYGEAVLFEPPCQNGSIKYGLSLLVVDWGSADHACPRGTWVCKEEEIVACDTTWPDFANDALDCDGSGIAFTGLNVRGWVANVEIGPFSGTTKRESGSADIAATCQSYPVWCCWE